MDRRMTNIYHLLQFSDATFPVGTFSFSNGLETASYLKIVHDADTLRQYTRSAARQAAFTDGVAAIHAFRNADIDFNSLTEADYILMASKMNDEARLMLQRMGKKLAELSVRLFPGEVVKRWLSEIDAGATPGSYPISQGVAFRAAGLSEEDLFTSHQYGVINMILGASLRCVRVSHLETQEILYDLAEDIPALYDEVKNLTIYELNCFVPEMDIFASMHEKGQMRMFMS